jgi:hypothetical protein
MLANRVKDTATGTTGDLTLANSAPTGFQTFNNAFGTTKQMYYFIQDGDGVAWESGIGHLTTSTNFVRDLVTGNSAGTISALTLSGGTHTVINTNTASNSNAYPSGMSTLSNGQALMSNSAGSRTSGTIEANQLYYIPYHHEYSGPIEGVGYSGSGTGGDVLCALYSLGTDGLPDEKILGGTALQTAASSIVYESFTSQILATGWYWMCFWSDAAISCNLSSYSTTKHYNMAGQHSNGTQSGGYKKVSVTSLTTLPQSAIAPTNYLFATHCPYMALDPT